MFDEDNKPPLTQAQTNANLGDRDMELYTRWKSTGDKRALRDLVNSLKPIILKEVNALSGSLPQSALKGEAVSWTIRAINTYSPDKGTKLSTHAYNWVQKTKRLNYQHQNFADMGEDKQRLYGQYNNARTQLEDELGRQPNHKELAHKLGWTEKETSKFATLIFNDFSESGATYAKEHSSFNQDAIKLNYIKSHLTKEELELFNDRANDVPAGQTAARMNMNINAYNYAVRKLREKVEKLIKDYGEW